MQRTRTAALFNWTFRRMRRRLKKWDITPLAPMWIVWKMKIGEPLKDRKIIFYIFEESLFVLISFSAPTGGAGEVRGYG